MHNIVFFFHIFQKVALVTAKHMLSMCKASSASNEGSPSIEHTDTRSIFQLYTTELSDKDSSNTQIYISFLIFFY
jgi:hypothetical protein